ncbi:MAG TPA: hypothetical protein VIH35_06440 [Kiritimatiellia bacterium]|jgi:hypothetical protein
MSTQQYVEFPTHDRPRTEIPLWKIFAMGLMFAAVILGGIYTAKGAFVRQMIMGTKVGKPNGELLTFQSMAIFLWCSSISNVILKNIRVGKERKAMTDDLIPQNIDMTNSDQMLETYNKLKAHPKLTKLIGVTRCLRVLSMWINTRDFERTAQYAKEEGEIDMFSADSSYRMNRLFIWAMPLVGFVGTVYGVSYGIGNFADFLKGGAVTAEGIKQQVGLITAGLAIAFYCTLMGLMTAGLAAFPGLAAERKEESILEHITEYVEDRLISRFPSVKKTEFPVQQIVAMREGIERIKINFPADELIAAMQNIKFDINLEPLIASMKNMNVSFPMDDLAKAIDQGFRRMPDPDRYEKVFTGAIEKASGLVSGKYEEFAKGYEHRITELTAKLAAQFDKIAVAFQSGSLQTSQEMAKHTQEFVNQGRGQVEKLQAVVGSLEKTTVEYAQRVTASTQDLTKQLENVTKLGQQIEKVLHVTQSMEAMMSEVTGAEDFRKTLANLREHLSATDDLMRQLSRPRTVVLEESIG